MAGYSYPRVRLNPRLRQAAVRAMAHANPSGPVLAFRSGFPHQALFSKYLHAPTLAGTPVMFQRFTRLASMVGFKGEVFLPDGDAPECQQKEQVAHVE